MKSILTTILFTLVLTTGLFAQQTITNEKHERILTHVEGNVFDVQFLDMEGKVMQEGQYWREGELFKPHGTWYLFSQDDHKVVTKATYIKGEQITIETVINGEILIANKQQLAAKDK
ncbi:MAG: hypothetical protein RI564_12530 [Gracilimonas sp.]|nr:hypothetical protein [Gracilimonas sp.]